MAIEFLEPDLGFTWDARRAAALRAVLDSPGLEAELSGETGLPVMPPDS